MEQLDFVVDSVVIGQDWQDDIRVILFVKMQADISLDQHHVNLIRETIRRNTTPRHVPAKIIAVKDIPRTISGKIAELAVRKIVHGETVNNTDTLANPESLAWFRDLEALRS